jgi:hypothetical protein
VRRGFVDQLAATPDTTELLVLETGRYIGEGFDDSRLDTLLESSDFEVPVHLRAS